MESLEDGLIYGLMYGWANGLMGKSIFCGSGAKNFI
jgi:hypothetical protein